MPNALKHMAILDALTDKQREVLIYISEGLTSKEIARKLSISESAVNQRIETIRQRLGGLPRSQIARLYRHQGTLLMTIPTSNSLTGNPIQLQSASGAGQVSGVEGAADHVAPRAHLEGSVLQPSTNSRTLQGPTSLWFKLGAIFAIAVMIAVIALLLLSIAATLDRLLT